MTKQIIYFAGVLLLMMAAALVVSAQDVSPALNATINNTTLNNTTLNNTTINATIPLVNVTSNETISAAENISINVTANQTLPSGNETVIPVEAAPVNVTAPEVIEAPPAANETATAVVSAPPIVPAAGRLGKMETEPAQTVMLGMKAKPTFVVGSGLSNNETVTVGATEARATYTVGAPVKSTIGL